MVIILKGVKELMILILPLTEKDGEIRVDIEAEYLEDDLTQQVVTI